MKKSILFLICLASFTGISKAAWMDDFMLGKASFTASNEGPINIPLTYPGTVLWSVQVATPQTGGLLKIYDSSGTANTQIGAVSLTSVMDYHFEVKVSSGLTYTTTGNSSGITIVYKITRPM